MKPLRILIPVIQFLFGATFIVSGISKCIDPAGTAIKMAEYMNYFGMRGLATFSMPISWMLCLVEFYCGVSLTYGRGRLSSIALSTLMMLFFTPLTLWLALTDAISDCGCFGDLFHLSNNATFVKNLVLDAMLVLIIAFPRYTYSLKGIRLFKLFKRCVLIGAAALCWIGTRHEPIVDFRPFLPGTDLVRSVLEATPADSTWYTFVYERQGQQQEFTIDDLPDEADGWEFVDRTEHHAPTSVNGVEPLDFFIKDDAGEDVTDIIGRPGYSIVMLSPSLDAASQHDIDRIERLSEYADDSGYVFFCLTARDSEQLANWRYNTGAEYPVYFTDVTIIQTICRTNPCVMLLHDGVILWKKPLADIDTEALTSAKLDEQISGQIEEIYPDRRFLCLLILLFAPITLYLLVKIPTLTYNFLTKKDSKDA